MYIVVKKSDYTKDDLIEKLQDYCEVSSEEEFNEYGTWEICDYSEALRYFQSESEDYFGDWDITVQNIIENCGYRVGDDGELYEKVDTKYSDFDIKDIMLYSQAKEICSQKDNKAIGFIEDGELYFTKDEYEEQVKDCPFADNEEVYFIECFE